MKLSAAAFTAKGERLAEKIAEWMRRDNWDCTVTRVGRTGNCTLAQFTQTAFESSDALVYVGAVGIAVRAIAPHLKSKASDPAVLSVDELGRFVIPLAGGHIGGGNRLAGRVAGDRHQRRVCGGQLGGFAEACGGESACYQAGVVCAPCGAECFAVQRVPCFGRTSRRGALCKKRGGGCGR